MGKRESEGCGRVGKGGGRSCVRPELGTDGEEEGTISCFGDERGRKGGANNGRETLEKFREGPGRESQRGGQQAIVRKKEAGTAQRGREGGIYTYIDMRCALWLLVFQARENFFSTLPLFSTSCSQARTAIHVEFLTLLLPLLGPSTVPFPFGPHPLPPAPPCRPGHASLSPSPPETFSLRYPRFRY